MYVALKPCKFAGQQFRIGETIDTSVILKEAAPRLIKMGVIAAVGENSGVKSEPSNDTDSKAGENSAPAPTIDETKDEKTSYTKGALDHMNKKELLAVAEKLGVEATEEMKNADIIDLIMQEQGE